VRIEHGTVREAASTVIADELLVFLRDVHVCLVRAEVAVALVRTVAQIAFEASRFILVVFCHVLLKFLLSGESETTLGALENAGVASCVRSRVVKLLLALKTHLLDVCDHEVVLLGHVLR
jgi:hypothetical protein